MNFLIISILIHLFALSGINFPDIHSDSIRVPAVADSAEIDSTADKNLQLMLLPIIFSSPDTRLAFGVLPQLVFRTSSSNKPSSVRLDSYYTLNKQYHFLLRPTFWFRNDTRSLSGKLSFKKWPTSFYGIGKEAESTKIETFTETLYDASIEGITNIHPGLFAGASYSMRYGRISTNAEQSVLSSGAIPGSGNTFISGIGAVIQRDTRDNHFFPESGSLHKIELYTALKQLGSDYGFTRFTVDLRKYISLYPSHVLAIQAVGVSTFGTVPFRILPSVGNLLRGYSTVRHIDRNLIGFQMEYRVVPLAWRLGFVAFAGVADVFRRPGEIKFNNLKYVTGIGIRYQFSRSEKINIRVDYGVGRDSSGDYIDINEAY